MIDAPSLSSFQRSRDAKRQWPAAVERRQRGRPQPVDAEPGSTELQIAVLIPCLDEAPTIAGVVSDFRAALPGARIYVYDNNSTDGTAEAARAAGAQVRHEPLPGKGNVLRRMLSDIDADIYVLVDGDATYDASAAPRLVTQLLADQLDMVVGARVAVYEGTHRTGHALGNHLLTRLVAYLFGQPIEDMLSGYRVLSRRFAKSFPALSRGFEVETELTVHALELRLRFTETPTDYRPRPLGSTSKLRTVRDGLGIARAILRLLKEERPLPFFATVFGLLASTSLALAWPVIGEFLATGLVPRLPTAVLAATTMLLAFLALACGLVLESVTLTRRELKRLAYLAMAPPPRSR